MTRDAQIHIHGRGKVGTALAAGLREAGWSVRTTSHRRCHTPSIHALIVVLAVRDGELGALASSWAAARNLPAKSVVLHTAGARDARELAALRAVCRGVGQMHPLLSFASARVRAPWRGATLLIDGDGAALAAARAVARALGMQARRMPELDRSAYHAAAGLLAGGAAALAWAARQMLSAAGVDARTAEAMLAPLLRSVANNVDAVGLPSALSGPIRRGDALAVAAHLRATACYAPQHIALLRAVGREQLEMAAVLGEVEDRARSQARKALEGPTERGNREPASLNCQLERDRKVDRKRRGR